jgi:NhaA family Na+:H+ antiporter
MPAWLLLTLLGMILSMFLNKKKVMSYWPYIIFGGALSWSGLYLAHIHAALALVFIIPFLPHKEKETLKLFESKIKPVSALEKFERDFSTFVDFGLFMFGLINAGVMFSEVNNLTWIVLLSLLIGKTGGIFIFSSISSMLGFKMPKGMDKKDLFTAGIIASMGLTVALFLSGAAFVDTALQGSAKMGALFSAAAFLIALAVSKILRIKKKEKTKCENTVFDIAK